MVNQNMLDNRYKLYNRNKLDNQNKLDNRNKLYNKWFDYMNFEESHNSQMWNKEDSSEILYFPDFNSEWCGRGYNSLKKCKRENESAH